MKNTYLVKKRNEAGDLILTEVTAAEWYAVLAENRGRPKEQRRYFIADCIGDGKEMDRMFIEVSREEHHRWNSSHTISERKRAYGKKFALLSLDEYLVHAEGIRVVDTLADPYCMEDEMMSELRMAELERALRAWKPWAIDFYEAYLAGEEKHCVAVIAGKYGVSDRMARTYRSEFEKFVKNFLT